MNNLKNLVKLSFSLYRRSPMIAATSILSVMISVSLVITMAMFAINIKESVTNNIKQTYGNMDLSVGYEVGSTKVIDSNYIKFVNNNKNVKEISPVLLSNLPVSTKKSKADVYTIGIKNDELAKSRYHVTKKIKQNQAIINEDLAKSLGVKVNDEISVQDKNYQIIEILKDAKSAGIQADILILKYDDLRARSQMNNQAKLATYLLIKTKDTADNLKLANYFTKTTKDIRVDVAESEELLSGGFQSMNAYIVLISALILIVSSFILISNFDVFMRKYRYQLSVMRTIGASSKQLFTIFMVQSGVIVLLGSSLSVLFASLIHTYFQDSLIRFFSISVTNGEFQFKIIYAVTIAIISFVIIQLILATSSYKNSKVLPLNVMRKNNQVDFLNSKSVNIVVRVSWVLFVVFTLISIIMAAGPSQKMLFIFLSIVSYFIALYVGLPQYLNRTLNIINPFSKKIFGNISYIAIKNIIPQVRKNTFLILIINVLMVIVVLGSTMLNTVKENGIEYIEDQYPTNIVIKSRIIEGTDLNPYILMKEIQDKLPDSDINFTSIVHSGERYVGDSQTESMDYVATDINKMKIFGILDKKVKDKEFSIVVSDKYAKKFNLKIGDNLKLGIFSSQEQDIIPAESKFEIVGIGSITVADIYFDWSNKFFRDSSVKFNKLFIKSNKTVESKEVLKNLNDKYPTLQINTFQESLEEANKQFTQRWFVFMVAIFVMVLSVLMGIFNSLVSYLNTKRREYGILRAISLTPKELKKLILIQIFMFVSIGILLGIVSGMVVSTILSIIDPGKIYFDYTLVGIVVLVILLSIFISFLPLTQKMSRKNLKTELISDEV